MKKVLVPENNLEQQVVTTLDPCSGCKEKGNVLACVQCPKLEVAADFDETEVLEDFRNQQNSLFA